MNTLYTVGTATPARAAMSSMRAPACYLENVPLGLRSEGRDAARAAYVGYFTAFPDLGPEDEGEAFGDDVMVVWGHLKGSSGGDWLGVPPSGGAFRVPSTNITTSVREPGD